MHVDCGYVFVTTLQRERLGTLVTEEVCTRGRVVIWTNRTKEWPPKKDERIIIANRLRTSSVRYCNQNSQRNTPPSVHTNTRTWKKIKKSHNNVSRLRTAKMLVFIFQKKRRRRLFRFFCFVSGVHLKLKKKILRLLVCFFCFVLRVKTVRTSTGSGSSTLPDSAASSCPSLSSFFLFFGLSWFLLDFLRPFFSYDTLTFDSQVIWKKNERHECEWRKSYIRNSSVNIADGELENPAFKK